ncbi:quinone-dependent dihydroorotate dehydrogenase [Propioniciclava soli]|uniref:Multifunctional fusion protein n=1 Tax=Propioniciclava soli TaxID=2775081 RepID=A0ABZ3C297_9ACTN
MVAVALIGLSGSGKSTLGPLLAQRLGVPHIDVDAAIERREARSIRAIFDTDGEAHFRALERDRTRESLAGDAVVSLGGGAPMTPAVADALAGHPVVWLQADPATAARRVGDDPNRPLLSGSDAVARLEAMLAERGATYALLATLAVDTADADPAVLVETIAAHAESFRAATPASPEHVGGSAGDVGRAGRSAGVRAAVVAHGYRRVLRPVLFRARGGDPERIHEDMIAGLARLGDTPGVRAAVGALTRTASDPVEVAGITFGGRVGLAAGMDKDGRAALAWQHLGFAFAELGTVTARPQPGNPRPRMFRAPASGGLVNRMGFNNGGAAALAARLASVGIVRNSSRENGPAGIPLGISIGKSKDTALDDAVGDYLFSLRAVAPHADYVAINVSSPNTPGLRSLQDGGALAELLGALVAETRTLDAARPVPVFVKIAPDLSWSQVDEVLATATDAGASGIIATNTTLSRDGLAPADAALAHEAGGLSGAPLTQRARAVVRHVAAHTDLPVMGSGGVMTPDDAVALLDAGASLVQLYTGFVYAGPALIAGINARR